MTKYVVIHMEKRKEISAVLERHILRAEVKYKNGQRIESVWSPDNADTEKARLNQELVSRVFVDSETNKRRKLTISQAIYKRIKEAGIEKIRENQNIALEIILTGSTETMNGLDEDKLKEWTSKTMDWAGKQWGSENIVTAVLHRDEKTPHIHLILVPIVQGLSRRSKARDEERLRSGKQAKTRKRNEDGNRLSANEVFTTPRLFEYHTSYAEEVGKDFGLGRGVRGEKGSRKKHQTSEEYNRLLAREEQERRLLIAELTSEYSDKYENLSKVDEEIARSNNELEAINAEILSTKNHLNALNEAVKNEEEKKRKAKKEADTEETRLKDLRKLNDDEEERYWALRDEEGRLLSSIKQMQAAFERGRDIENIIAERENYLRSLSSKSLFELMAMIPELIKKEMNILINKYLKGEIVSLNEEELPSKDAKKDKILNMRMAWEGKNYELGVRESDGRVWIDQKPFFLKNGNPAYMPEIAGYCSRALSSEGKELVTSLYRKTEFIPGKNDPIVARLREKFGDIAYCTMSTLMTEGEETGRMYHFTVHGKDWTAVYDLDSKEISICSGHAKKGAFYLENWTTIGGKPAVVANNRVYPMKQKKQHQGIRM